MFSMRIRVCALVFALRAFGADRWMETRMAGTPVGYVHEQTEGMVTAAESRLVINRLGSKVEINAKTRSEENAEGRLAAIRSEISSSAQATVTEGHVEGNILSLRISTGGKSYDHAIPIAQPLVGDEGARRLTLARLHQAGDQVSYPIFSPELGTVAIVTRIFVAREGKGMRIKQTMTGLPGDSSVWLDEEGRMERQVQAGPFGDVEVRLATREKALAAIAGSELPAESYEKSVAISNIRLPHERRIERMRVLITHNHPELGWPDFTDDRQTLIEQTRDHVVLEIRRDTDKKDPAPSPSYLSPNALFQSDDAAVMAIAHGKNDIFVLRDWTSENVRFDAGIAIAPASEVARDRAGTCFGYSILLGSLARAAGIPSRLKMGLAYAGGIWGGHAWVETYQQGKWVAIDAALVSPGIADAARISFFSSSLEEGSLVGMGSLAQMYGNVGIRILEYTVDGKTVTVPENAPQFTIAGDVYENPWLGLKLRKPAGFRFAKEHAVWPDPILVAMEGPNGEVVTVEKTELPLEEYMKRKKDEKGIFAVTAGGDTWVLSAEGPAFAKALKNAVAGFELTGVR